MTEYRCRIVPHKGEAITVDVEHHEPNVQVVCQKAMALAGVTMRDTLRCTFMGESRPYRENAAKLRKESEG